MKSDDEVRAMVGRLLDNSIGSVGSDTRWDTTRMLDQYHGRKYGTEVEGRSQIVTRDVLEAIEWAMPSLLRVFASGKHVVEFTPFGDEDEQQAKLETEYVNHVFMNDSKGWDVLNQWFRSALLERNAYVKVHWDTQRHTRIAEYKYLTKMQLAMVLKGINTNVPTGYRFEAATVLEQQSTMMLDSMGVEVEIFDVKVREVSTRGFARVEYVPREEIRISKDIRELCLDDCTMVAHVRSVQRSDAIQILMGMGFSYEEAFEACTFVPSDKKTDLASNTVQYARQNERSTQRTEYSAPDEAGELIQFQEAWVRLDVDEDGISELRRVLIAGDRVLVNDEVTEQPFVALCPIPQPSTHIGLGLGDLTEDIQLIKTHLWRGILDNLALTNNPEKEVVWDDVLFEDDFMTSVVGGNKRVARPGTVNPLVVPFTAGSSIPILEMLDVMRETRTGISKNSMGLDADQLAQSTVGAFSMGLEQANQRLEMIARTFAETGMTWLFLKLRGLILRYQDAPRMIRLNGEFVEVDPRDWSERYDVVADVGLGTGRTAQTLGHLQAIAQKQEEHLLNDSPLVDFDKLYNTYERLVNAAGFAAAKPFFNAPESPEFQRRQQESAEKAQAAQQAEREQMEAMVNMQMADIQSRTQRELAKVSEDFQKFLEENRRKWAELELKYVTDVPGEGIDSAAISGSNGSMQ